MLYAVRLKLRTVHNECLNFEPVLSLCLRPASLTLRSTYIIWQRKKTEKKEPEQRNDNDEIKSRKELIIEKLKNIDKSIEFEVKSKIDGIEVEYNIRKEKKHHCRCSHNNDNDEKDENQKSRLFNR